ncbi:tyrosine-type recombinase/integrase [Pasteurella testudinis]|uniref:tyrosine-type recombinase/integrase n=1 Tax=Pasteurella testudinis TaxID=761 RepID=UPI0040583478
MRRVQHHCPGLLPHEITTEHLLNWRKIALNTTIKPITWNSYIRHLRALYSFSIKKGFIQLRENPCDDIFVEEGKTKRKIHSTDQLEKIITFLNNEELLPEILKPNWFSTAVFLTFRCTGIRRSQLVALKIKDIDLIKKSIFIEPNTNKNHDYHTIPISDTLYPHLKHLINELHKIGQTNDRQLFNLNLFCRVVRRKGLPTTKNQISQIFKVISEKTHVHTSPHRYRHTAATRLMKNPENVYIVQKLLGHKSIKTTLGYIEYDVDMIREYANSL